MSRIGRLPVAIPAGVEVTVADGNVVTVKGPKGTLERALPTELEIKVEDGHVVVTRPNDLKRIKALHGLTRSLIHNMVVGVSEGYKKELEVNGVGYRAAKQGKKLVLNLGYSHPVEMEDPEGLESTVDGNKIIVSGISKEKVGQYAAEIRDKRRPEPYKGKGIKYNCSLQILTCFCMYRNGICTTVHKILNITFRCRYHQMYVKKHFGFFADRTDHRHSKRNTRHKISIHNINVKPFNSCFFQSLNLFAQTVKVRRQN